MENFFIKNKTIFAVTILLILAVSFFMDRGLSVGLCLIFILSAISFFVLHKLGIKDKKIYWLFLICLAIHLAATLFMHYANFQPFSGGIGDYVTYQKSAVEASQALRQGIFSIKGIVAKYPDFYSAHYYPLIVGSIYAISFPEEIIGLMLNVWLVAISIVFVYLIILEIGGTGRSAFLIGLIAAIYPSYIFNTGLLLKEAIEIFCIFVGLLFIIKAVKKVTWYNFLVLYLAIIATTHFRFYVGYALIAAFLISWFLFSNVNIKKRIVYGFVFIILLGFIPQIAFNQGYYGISTVKTYLNSKMITYYRQIAYNPSYYKNSSPSAASSPSGSISSPATGSAPSSAENSTSFVGLDSSFKTGGGMFGYIKSFTYVLFGPFPWQIKNLRQVLALFETVPWYFLLYFIMGGILACFKNRAKEIAPLVIFSGLLLLVIAVFDNNFGLIVRVRIPVFISLLCVASLNPAVLQYVDFLTEKIYKIKALGLTRGNG